MVKKSKYEKYISEVDPIKFLYFVGTNEYVPAELNHYDYRDNEESPHFVEINQLGGAVAKGRKGIKSPEALKPIGFIDPRIYYSTCYRHAPMRESLNCRLFYETRSFFSLNPDDPEDIGCTMHMWLGKGEDAELTVFNKPTTQLVPRGVIGVPSYVVETHGKSGMMLIICDTPLEAIVPERYMTPPARGEEDYKGEKWIPPTDKPTPIGQGKYGKYYSEINVKGLPVYPNHKGKLTRVMYYDGCNNPEAPHCFDCHLICEAGVGFGTGDAEKLPLLPNGETDQTVL